MRYSCRLCVVVFFLLCFGGLCTFGVVAYCCAGFVWVVGWMVWVLMRCLLVWVLMYWCGLVWWDLGWFNGV